MRIVVAGIIGRYPWGGVTWCSLMYLHGLRALGHDVYYVEDTRECNYDPDINATAKDPVYALRYIAESLTPFGFGDRWCYIDFLHNHHGLTHQQVKEICATADLLLVLSGGIWIWRDEYLSIPQKIFIDSDPAFTQLSIDNAVQAAAREAVPSSYVDFFKIYNHLFTFGQNIGTHRSTVPVNGLNWIPTTQPVCVDLWHPPLLSSRPVWTTVMTWQIESFADVGGNKDKEFLKVLDLSNRCKAAGAPELEIAVNGPQKFLTEHGWRCIDPFPVSKDLWRYHNYLTSSRGEFSVAKNTYVSTNSGWFSDRTACYLAAGKPAVVQETGLSSWLPTGAGLITWKTEEEAFHALQDAEGNYQYHCDAARSLAVDHLSSGQVLNNMLGRCS